LHRGRLGNKEQIKKNQKVLKIEQVEKERVVKRGQGPDPIRSNKEKQKQIKELLKVVYWGFN